MSTKSSKLIPALAWLIALGLAALAGYLTWKQFSHVAQAADAVSPPSSRPLITQQPDAQGLVTIPPLMSYRAGMALARKADLHTIIPDRPSTDVITYTVEMGDSVFEIANQFKIKPETLLWANYSQLNDNPDMISVGMQLNIPPVDGVYYEWQAGDTLEMVAGRFEAQLEEILNWPGNGLDLTHPVLEAGTWVMVPGGHREFRQWIIPVIPRGAAGVSRALYGAGACEGSYEGAYGSGAFIWPAGNHVISGNDYWSGHLGIDIAAGEGAPIYAADAGVVVFSGWATGGYGNMVMVDHGNGYQTVYAHMSNATAGCGRSVGQGSIIGYSGSTGNSTGAHLHFEVRFQGGFVSPWYVLPAP